MSVVVRAPARLHLGMLDVPGGSRRRYGGIGVGIAGHGVAIRATRTPGFTAEGPDAELTVAAARTCAAALALPGGAHVQTLEAIPAHVGLGSGTKRALAVARALAELYERPTDPLALAAAVGRAGRSAVGLWTFAGGGLVVEGGVRAGEQRPSPLLVRLAVPEDWRVVLAIPRGGSGLHGPPEVEAFRALATSGAAADGTIARTVLTALLPAVVEGDVAEFGDALTEIQRRVGAAFATAQGGIFHPRSAPVVAALTELGAAGIGQSSWGPTVYGVVGTSGAADAIARRLRERVGDDVAVSVERFASCGARVEAA